MALCTHNHADRLQLTLDALGTLESPCLPWEILVIDNASSDETSTLLAAMSWRPVGIPVRVVRENKLGLSNARNRAIAEAEGSYIVFIDDDETPDSGWLVAYANVISELRPDALGGPIEISFMQGERPRWLGDELLGFLGRLDYGGDCRALSDPATPIFGGNFGFNKSVFAKIGNFDSRLGRTGTINIGGEDTEIYARLIANGCHVRWVPEAVICHRIETGKLRRRYFLDLHFHYGRTEGSQARNARKRIPPAYLMLHLIRACRKSVAQRRQVGFHMAVRQDMNVAYFCGYICGWILN